MGTTIEISRGFVQIFEHIFRGRRGVLAKMKFCCLNPEIEIRRTTQLMSCSGGEYYKQSKHIPPQKNKDHASL